MLSLLPSAVEVHYEAMYEHLDFLWADTAKARVFPAVEDFLRRHSEDSDSTSVTSPM